MPALGSLNVSVNGGVTVAAANTTSGLQSGPAVAPTFAKTWNFLSTTTASSAGGANMIYYALHSLGASATANIDLTSFTDILGTSAQSMARVKGFRFQLLGASDYAPDGTTVGTTATQVAIGAAATDVNKLFLSTTTATRLIDNAGGAEHWAGAGTGEIVNSTNKNVLITNSDGATTAKLLVLIVGGAT